MTMQSTRRTFVGGAVVAAAALGSVAMLRGGGEAPLASGVIPARSPYTPAAANLATASPEVRQWAAAIGQPVRLSGAPGGTAGRIHQVLSGPRRRVPAGVREQSFLVYLEVDRISAPFSEGMFDIASPIAGLSRVYVNAVDLRGAKAMLLAIFA